MISDFSAIVGAMPKPKAMKAFKVMKEKRAMKSKAALKAMKAMKAKKALKAMKAMKEKRTKKRPKVPKDLPLVQAYLPVTVVYLREREKFLGLRFGFFCTKKGNRG